MHAGPVVERRTCARYGSKRAAVSHGFARARIAHARGVRAQRDRLARSRRHRPCCVRSRSASFAPSRCMRPHGSPSAALFSDDGPPGRDRLSGIRSRNRRLLPRRYAAPLHVRRRPAVPSNQGGRHGGSNGGPRAPLLEVSCGSRFVLGVWRRTDRRRGPLLARDPSPRALRRRTPPPRRQRHPHTQDYAPARHQRSPPEQPLTVLPPVVPWARRAPRRTEPLGC